MKLKINDVIKEVELTNTGIVNSHQYIYILEAGQRAARHRLPSAWLLGDDKRRVFTNGNWYAKV